MIGSLIGPVESTGTNPVTVFAGDVGYSVSVPPGYLPTAATTERRRFFVHTTVKDDAIELYGFATPEELKLFELLIGVSGIGPKTALFVVDRGVETVLAAVRNSDVEAFTGIPRLGLKNAQKIIIELAAKVGVFDANAVLTGGLERDEVTEALTAMGFTRKEIDRVMQKGDRSKPVTDQIKEALKFLGK
jgi:Holliday junction DNA helicase RuvA subunit